MRKDSTIAELLERLDEEIQNPKDSVHKIVLKITIDNIKKLIKRIESGYFFFFVSFFYFRAKKILIGMFTVAHTKGRSLSIQKS